MTVPALLPDIRYRIMASDDLTEWSVRWLCGSTWLLVEGPGSKAEAREYLDGMRAQGL